MRARGHALVWYAAQPKGLEPALQAASERGRRKLMTSYITTAMPRYAGRIQEWDVVNEALEPNDGRADGMRADSMWMQALGERYIDIAFHTARETDPRATLFLTDYGIEHDSPRCERRRTAMLKLLDRLNTLFCAGGMTLGTRTLILSNLAQIPADQPEARARVAVYLVMTSPEGAVMK